MKDKDNFETERQTFLTEISQLEEKLRNYKREVERLREPPLVAAVIVSVDEEKGRVTIVSSTGPMFVVNISRRLRNHKLEKGMFVGLNQRTFAIMEILSMTKEEVGFAKNKIDKN
ncbi:MAG: hypothetical protein ACW96X_11040 [Promethearchaeota archaeon]